MQRPHLPAARHRLRSSGKRNHSIPHLPLDNIKNLALKNLGVTMMQGGLGASAIRAYIQVVKMVVASAVNEEGEALYPRKWNHDFIDLPVVKDQKQPIFAGDAVTGIVAAPAKKYHRVLYTLCALVDCDSVRRWGSTSRTFPRTAEPSKSVRRRGGMSSTIT
jgi:hypothetical protein